VLRDPQSAPISDELRATLVFLREMTLDPDGLTADHVAATRAAGVDRESLRDAIYVAAIFNVIDRVADGLGFDLLTDEGFSQTAKILLRFGYRL
jgi:alkylhydroperoxidase family enzyme